jgi:hypothetical protein
MRIFQVYTEGFNKAMRLPKTVVLLWAISLVGTIFVVAPLERNIGHILDGYLVSELLYDGEDAVAYADIVHAILPTLSSFSISFFLVGAIIFLLNTFITAGLFRVLAGKWKKKYKTGTFLKGADRGFPSFLFVSVATGLIMFLLIIILLLTPLFVVLVNGAGNRFLDLILYCGLLILFLITPVVLLTADYARVIITSDKWTGPSRAVVDGFSLVRTDFMKKWLIMAVWVAVYVVISYITMKIAPYSQASTGFGILLLLIVSQLFVFLNIWLKVIRYGTITALWENSK